VIRSVTIHYNLTSLSTNLWPPRWHRPLTKVARVSFVTRSGSSTPLVESACDPPAIPASSELQVQIQSPKFDQLLIYPEKWVDQDTAPPLSTLLQTNRYFRCSFFIEELILVHGTTLLKRTL
jgi:hypothetical protein